MAFSSSFQVMITLGLLGLLAVGFGAQRPTVSGCSPIFLQTCFPNETCDSEDKSFAFCLAYCDGSLPSSVSYRKTKQRKICLLGAHHLGEEVLWRLHQSSIVFGAWEVPSFWACHLPSAPLNQWIVLRLMVSAEKGHPSLEGPWFSTCKKTYVKVFKVFSSRNKMKEASKM